jgi:hypothetical protein
MGASPNFCSIMFNPTCLGHYLTMFELMLPNNFASVIKDHKASTASALI